MLDHAHLDKIAEYFASGDLTFDFEHGDEARRQDILAYLEKLMDGEQGMQLGDCEPEAGRDLIPLLLRPSLKVTIILVG